MGCTELNQKNLEIGCMELFLNPKIECMKWEFKSSI
jgi:hypothetical protein